jgi:hypothetical protein
LKRDEVIGGWRKLGKAGVHNLYSSPIVIRIIKSKSKRWESHKAHMGAKKNACKVLMGKSEGTRSLGRPGYRWEDDIERDIRDVRFQDLSLVDMKSSAFWDVMLCSLLNPTSTESRFLAWLIFLI